MTYQNLDASGCEVAVIWGLGLEYAGMRDERSASGLRRPVVMLAVGCLSLSAALPASGQQIRYPTSPSTATGQAPGIYPQIPPPGAGTSSLWGTNPYTSAPSPANPYAANPGMVLPPTGGVYPQPTYPVLPPAPVTQPPFPAPTYPPTYPQPPYPGYPQYPPPTYPNPSSIGNPPALFPNGMWNDQWTYPGAAAGGWAVTEPMRFFQGPRVRHGWVAGDNRNTALGIHDTDVSLAFACPDFLGCNQPLYILPSFSFHQWDGPANVAADLPARAFSAFIDSGWESDPMKLWGAELGVRVGVFSDFDAISSDSIRVLGKGLGRLRLTPTCSLRAGVLYVNRNQVKLLPAGGLLWQPNPQTRFDIYFPDPKLSTYLSSIGQHDMWWYLSGFFGGGTWTVRRTSGASEAVDINDIRVNLGLEWGQNEMIRQGRRIGFAEAGYVFNRHIRYQRSRDDDLALRDSFFVRVGVGY
jgi:hypothetical protein